MSRALPALLAVAFGCLVAACFRATPPSPAPAGNIGHEPVRFDVTGPRPHYPDILASARVSATARARIVIDTNGRVIPSRTRLLHAEGTFQHPLTDAALLSGLPTFRFTRGRSPPGPSETSLDIKVRFVTTLDDQPGFPVFRQETYPWGIRIIIGIESVARAAPAPKYSSAAIREIHTAVLRAMLPLTEAKGRNATCVAIRIPDDRENRYGDPEGGLLNEIRIPGLVPHSQCPRSYWRMFSLIDSLGNRVPSDRPPGYLDPASMSIERIDPWTTDAAVVDVRTGTGGSGRIVRCTLARLAPKSAEWQAICQTRGYWVS